MIDLHQVHGPRRRHRQKMDKLATASILALLLVLMGCSTTPDTWSIEHEVPEAALLSVLSTDLGVYVVGADDGEGPVVLRGQAGQGDQEGEWERLWTGDRGDLWWVTEEADGSVLMGGEDGRILRYDPDRGTFEAYVTPRGVTIFGIWSGPDGTAYAVGGDINVETARGELWIRQDGEWARDERVPAEWLDAVLMFKVWGSNANDVWAVGESGTVLHFDGTAWEQMPAPVSTRLLTVHGNTADGPIMVGGAGNGVLLEMSGGTLTDRMPPFMPGANGVFVEQSGTAWVVGNQGTVLSREAGGEWLVDETTPTRLDLHAITVDSEGAVWAVGGALLSPRFDQGIVVRLGQ